MLADYTPAPAAAPRGFTFVDVLRHDALDTFKTVDPERLRNYQTLLLMKIDEREETLATGRNILSNERAELSADIRWFRGIADKIADLLTTEYYTKRAV